MHSISSSAGLPAESAARDSKRVELPALAERRPRVDLRRGRGQLIALAVGLTVSGLLLYLTVHKLDVAAVLTALRTADPTRVALAVGTIGCMYFVQALRWRWIARREARLSTWRFLQYVVGGVAMNNAVPGRPGDIVRAHWLGRGANIPRANALGTIVVERSADLLMLVAALALTFPLVGPEAPWLRSLAVVTFVLTAGAVLGAVLAYRFRKELRERLGRRLPRVRLEARKLLTAVRRSCDLVGVAGVVIATGVSWALWGLAAWLVATSVGIGLSPLQVVFLTAVVNLGVAIPSSPGYVGTYQWLCVSALTVFGVSSSDAFAFSVISHAVWFVPSSLGGIALLAARWVRGSARVAEPAQLDFRTG
jgi:glycosyltransferase 2 family protein